MKNSIFVTIFSIGLLLAVVSCDPSGDIFIGEKHAPGFFELNEKTGTSLFYWLFYSRDSVDEQNDAPLIVWFTGGPGCSSELAIFYENGPFRISNDDLSLSQNSHSWNNKANVLYIDQPVGSGFSIGPESDFVANEEELAEDLHGFFAYFLEQFPQFKGRDTYFTGESYAGHYIPAVVPIFLEKGFGLTMKGIGIGNGWVDPYLQLPSFNEYAWKNKLIDDRTHAIAEFSFKICQLLINMGASETATSECRDAWHYVQGPDDTPKFNPYNIAQECTNPPLCADMTALPKFLARSDVVQQLNLGDRQWSMCNPKVKDVMVTDWILNYTPNVQAILDKGIPVVIYEGTNDFMCNWMGSYEWVLTLPTAEKNDFDNLEFKSWNADDKVAGEFKQTENLTFVKVFNAGHMVPMDQPSAAEVMLNTFIVN